MQLADAAAVPYRTPGTRHREGNIEFKYLLRGRSGSAQNYELSIVRTRERFFSPAHRHNFDQLRFVLAGRFGQPGALELKAGEVGYYPEGTPYVIESADTELMLVQFGGASGEGFTHYDELRASYPKMAQLGRFEDGIFRWNDPPPGEPRQKDGYEALWEQIHGRRLRYPAQRYRAPVVMNPAAFAWQPGAAAGAWVRPLGSFSERHIRVEQTRLEQGVSVRTLPDASIRLGYVVAGSGSLDGQPLHAGCAFELAAGEQALLAAGDSLLVLDLYLPAFPAGFTPGSQTVAAPGEVAA